MIVDIEFMVYRCYFDKLLLRFICLLKAALVSATIAAVESRFACSVRRDG